MRIPFVVSLLLCYVKVAEAKDPYEYNRGDVMCTLHNFPIPLDERICDCEDGTYCHEGHELIYRDCEADFTLIGIPLKSPQCWETHPEAFDYGKVDHACPHLLVRRLCVDCKMLCTPCGSIPHCRKTTCTKGDNQVCEQCEDGFYLHDIGECLPIPDNCLRDGVTSDGRCFKCKERFYSSGGICISCPEGMWCNGIDKRHCWDDSPKPMIPGYCPKKETGKNEVLYECGKQHQFGKDCGKISSCVHAKGICNKPKCWGGLGPEADGFCTECNDEFVAGKNCEHNVCRDSGLGKELANNYEPDITKFNFSRYEPEDVQVSQDFTGDRFGISVSFRPTSSDIEAYRLLINGAKVHAKSAGLPSCSTFENENLKMPTYELDDLVAVGDDIKVCIRAEWKDSTLFKTSGSWQSKTDGRQRPQPEVCTLYDVKYQTRIIFAVSDVYNLVPVKDTSITFSVGNERNQYTFITNDAGSIDTVIVIEDGVDPGTTRLGFNISNVARVQDAESSVADFYLCKGEPIHGAHCHESNRISLPLLAPLSVDHLNRSPQKYYIIDNTAVKIDGKIYFPSPDPDKKDVFCGIEKALVLAFDAKTDKLITNTTSDSSGNFEVAIPKATVLKLEIIYHGHNFTGFGENQASFDVLSGDGFVVKENLKGLQFMDKAMHDITVEAVVTDCGFDIGDFTLRLDVPSCPAVGSYEVKAERNNLLTLHVPAHVYSYNLIDFSGFGDLDGSGFVDADTVKKRFDFMFPSTLRQLNLTEGSDGINFTYHTEVEVQMNVRNGLHAPETFDQSTCSKDPVWVENTPFDFALEGNSRIDLLFKFHQDYPDGLGTICDHLPEGFTLKLDSLMGQELDPCDTNTGGCYFNVTRQVYQGADQSLAFGQVVSGSPRFNQSSIIDYVGSNSIVYTLFNKRYFSGDGKAGGGSSKVLLLGNKVLTEDSTVTYINEKQNHIPLLYLYAPPPGSSWKQVQSVRLDLNMKLTSQALSMEESSSSSKILGGIAMGVETKNCHAFGVFCNKVVDVKRNGGGGTREVNSINENYNRAVYMKLSGKDLTLSTPEGKFGDDGDMVLLLGVVSEFSESVYVSLDEESCQIREAQSIAWGMEAESLVFFSKSDCLKEREKLRKSKQINEWKAEDKSLGIEEREEAKRILNQAQISEQKWNDLFSHWEDDRIQALNHPVNLRDVTNAKSDGDSLNRMTFGASTIALTTTSSSSVSNVIDYVSSGRVFGTVGEHNSENLVFGVGVYTKSEHETLTTTRVETIDSEAESRSKTVTTTFVEKDTGDNLCVEFYESPHSGTFFFNVCGGSTMCPHIPGTDARQKIQLRTIDKPLAPLHQDSGQIVLLLDTSDMRDETIDTFGVVLELEPDSAGLPITFEIGSSSLGQPLEYQLRTGEETQLHISFERLESNLKSAQIKGKVRSECDPSIFLPFSYDIEWNSNCPSVNWGGDLAKPDATFAITRENPDLSLTALNPTPGTKWRNNGNIEVNVVLSYRRHKSLSDSWEILPGDALRSFEGRESAERSFVEKEDDAGLATLWLSADNNNYFRSGQKYEFELRSECYEVASDGSPRKVGETRSGPRLGIVDYEGPRIVAWKYTQELAMPTLGFPIIKVTFNEPIDCLDPLLSALIRTDFTTKRADVYCTDQLQQLNVVLQLGSQDDVNRWSEVDVDVQIEGVRDLFKNPYEGDPIAANLKLPLIPNITSAAKPWVMPTYANVTTVRNEALDQIIPRGDAIPSAHYYP